MLIAQARVEKQFDASIKTLREKPLRSLAKAISWRITGTLDTMVISWLLTGDTSTAVAIGLTEVITKTFLYYLHERIWNRVRIGYQN